jgi:hypothetical protein
MIFEKIRYLIPKLRNRLSVEKNRIWKHCNVERLSLCGYTPFKSADVFKERLHVLLGEFSNNTLEGVTTIDRQTIIDSADQALRHEFDLLGSGGVKFDPIDWHTDFKSGYHWSKKYYRELSGKPGADIKVPWELSRCQHLLWLGEAYLLTDDECYAQEVIDEINWWIKDNPLMYSVNWTCSMDVAFRAVNWMYALNMISGYKGFDDAFASIVLKSLWQHGFFIRNNLEKQIPFSNNHYASDIVGLLYLGAFFKDTTIGRRWYRFALRKYYSEVRTQVLPSGVHYERSVSYHRLMTELFSYPAYMLKRLGVNIPDDINRRIKGMYEYVATYTKPNGLAPLIADNDDGRFAPFFKREFRDHNYLNDSQSVENMFAALGYTTYSTSSGRSHYYPDAGVAVVKENNNYLYVNHGGYSKNPKKEDVLIGTHTHNDLLSFELCLNGKDVLIDAGTFLYTSSKVDRDEFRSTAKHNTIVVDGEEQNDFFSSFVLRRNNHKGKLVQVSDSIFEGDYTTIKGQMHHKRRFDFKNEALIITDSIIKDGTDHEIKMFFHFADSFTSQLVGNRIITDKGVSIKFDVDPDGLDIIDDTVSPSFGVLRKTKTGVATFKFANQMTIITTINSLT